MACSATNEQLLPEGRNLLRYPVLAPGTEKAAETQSTTIDFATTAACLVSNVEVLPEDSPVTLTHLLQ